MSAQHAGAGPGEVFGTWQNESRWKIFSLFKKQKNHSVLLHLELVPKTFSASIQRCILLDLINLKKLRAGKVNKCNVIMDKSHKGEILYIIQHTTEFDTLLLVYSNLVLLH